MEAWEYLPEDYMCDHDDDVDVDGNTDDGRCGDCDGRTCVCDDLLNYKEEEVKP